MFASKNECRHTFSELGGQIMKQKQYMSISEFARFSGINRANLIFYDKIGLLTPDYRGENGYRYYTHRQIGPATLIFILRDLGVSIEEIKHFMSGKTTKNMIDLFQIQEKRILAEINKLHRMCEMMELHTDMMKEFLTDKIDKIEVKERKEEPLFIGKPFGVDSTEDENTVDFFTHADELGIELSYPFGNMIVQNKIEQYNPKQGRDDLISQYYFKVKQGQNGCKPAGYYVVAYGYDGNEGLLEVYQRLFLYIQEHGLTICGNAYEEYLLDEMPVQSGQEGVVKVEIMVCSSFGF